MQDQIQNELVELYQQYDTPVDQLPYSTNLQRITEEINRTFGSNFHESTVWRTLMNIRKAGNLPRIRR